MFTMYATFIICLPLGTWPWYNQLEICCVATNRQVCWVQLRGYRCVRTMCSNTTGVPWQVLLCVWCWLPPAVGRHSFLSAAALLSACSSWRGGFVLLIYHHIVWFYTVWHSLTLPQGDVLMEDTSPLVTTRWLTVQG